ncbi:unnamed protein product, partial [Effrenium voratum]
SRNGFAKPRCRVGKRTRAAAAVMSHVDAAARGLEEVLRFHFGGNEVLGAPSSVPVAPALRCTILLTTLFFSVFLAVILLRVGRIFLSGRAEVSRSSWEARLAKATEALSLVPVVAILMIGTRLRAIQLAGDALAAPPMWAQLCMYGATLGCFFRFLTDVCCVRGEANTQEAFGAAAAGIRHTATAMLFICCAAILLSVLIMEAESASMEPLGPMMQCMMVLTIAYLAENGVREVLGARTTTRTAWKQEEYGSFSPSASSRDNDAFALPARISLQFPPMLCVLLIAIALRAVQLDLQPRLWAAFAMYMTTLATALQAARSMAAFVQSQGKNSLLGDEAAGPALSGNVNEDNLKMFWSATTCCIYVGTAVILLGVAAMESKSESLDKSPKPLSTAMWCVMALTIVYYGAYLVLMAGSLLRRFLGSWAQASASGVQRALAFAPMLCVMMIGVRMRAMQIGVRDPPYWTRFCMVVATVAVVTQVICSMAESDASAAGIADKDAATKLFLLVLVALRYAASLVLYLSVGSLMVSLAWMQPNLEV